MTTWTIRRDDHGYATAVERDGRTFVQLNPGTALNEQNAEELSSMLNRCPTRDATSDRSQDKVTP